MANFIAVVYATLKKEGIDTSGMSTDEAVKKFNELNTKENLKKQEIKNNQPETKTTAAKSGLKQSQAQFVAEKHTLGQLQTRLDAAAAVGNSKLMNIFLAAIYEKTKSSSKEE